MVNTHNYKRIKKNYLFNLLYQLFLLITPLVTAPYISRILGSSGIGKYSFSFSMATYFVLLASLGFNYYAQREIASKQSSKEEQSLLFWEILILKIVSTLFSVGVYWLLIMFNVFNSDYSFFLKIFSINIISVAFDITFLFQGNERFGIIALRNVLIKSLGIVFIFIFVKTKNDVWVYCLCQALIVFLSNVSLWVSLFKQIKTVKIKDLRLKKHIKPVLKLFVPTIAISVYTILDRTLIGILVPGTIESDTGEILKICDIENGYYEQSEKIVKIALTVITSLGAVMIPRNSNALADGDRSLFKDNVNKSLDFVFFIGMPMCLGLVALSSNFSGWFFGSGFEKVPTLMMIFCPLIIIIGISNVLGLQYLIPLRRDNSYLLSIVAGAILNFALNVILIPHLWSYGACIATVISELVVSLSMMIFCRKEISIFRNTILPNWKVILSSIIMFGAVFTTQLFLRSSIINTFILILEGVVLYFVFLLLFKEKRIIDSFKRLLKKNK